MTRRKQLFTCLAAACAACLLVACGTAHPASPASSISIAASSTESESTNWAASSSSANSRPASSSRSQSASSSQQPVSSSQPPVSSSQAPPASSVPAAPAPQPQQEQQPAAPQPEPAPAPQPEPPPTPAVDAAAVIVAGHAKAAELGLTHDPGLSLSTPYVGYPNPVDISILTQENAVGSIQYCAQYVYNLDPASAALATYNIVHSGNLIYFIYL